MLLHLGHHLARRAPDDAHGVVDGRDVAGELDVHHRPDDLDDLTDVLCSHSWNSVRGLRAEAYWGEPAPETTSMISLVMPAWRTLFM